MQLVHRLNCIFVQLNTVLCSTWAISISGTTTDSCSPRVRHLNLPHMCPNQYTLQTKDFHRCRAVAAIGFLLWTEDDCTFKTSKSSIYSWYKYELQTEQVTIVIWVQNPLLFHICKHLDVSTCYRCVHVPLDSSVMHTLTSVTSSMNVHPWSERIHGQNVPSRVHRIDVWLLRNKPPWVTNFHLMSLWWRMFAYTPIHRLMMVPVVVILPSLCTLYFVLTSDLQRGNSCNFVVTIVESITEYFPITPWLFSLMFFQRHLVCLTCLPRYIPAYLCPLVYLLLGP